MPVGGGGSGLDKGSCGSDAPSAHTGCVPAPKLLSQSGGRAERKRARSCQMAEWHQSRVMDDLQSQNLSMDMADSSPTLTNNRLENGMAQLITTEAWNINSTDLGAEDPEAQPQLLDLRIPSQPQEPTLPFEAVLQNLFPSQGALGPPPCPPPPGYAPVPPQPFNSPLSPLVPPATLLVPYPVIVPLPVPVPIPIPIPVPQSSESKFSSSFPKPPSSFGLHPFRGTQPPLQKEELKPFDILQPREYFQLSRHTVIKMGSENEALDLSMKSVPWLKAGEVSPPICQEDAALDLSLATHRKSGPPPETLYNSSRSVDSPGHTVMEKLPSGVEMPFAPAAPHEASAMMDTHVGGSNTTEQPSQPSQPCQPSGEVKAENNIEIVSESQAAKVIVSVEDTVPTIFCGKIKGLSGVSTKNFSFKREDSMLQGYDIHSQGEESMGNTESLRKPIKNRSIKLKKVNSQEIHMLPIKKQRLATFFPRK
ncbi:retinoic acid-induced protein 2 isoform X3 [Camelus ferus]|uniref:Retinoic acid-induced protein 2 isoform X3 n=2 Tax=Camelus TaxID=9836 RepID=A0A8B8SNJ0_CAMFR|nr:retinoic acid-induced protein 2 isoform X3 [Camelus ferus]XP_045372309.1 retinoic acid-induced protein 2 isoform X3 [Camelus bactrianus]